VNDHVGSAGSGIRRDARLHVEVNPLDEASGLHHIAQLGLAPDPARGVVSQRRGEGFRRAAQALFRLRGVAQLLGQLAVLQAALGFEFRHLQLHASQRFLHGSECLEHFALPLLAVVLGGLLAALAFDQFAILLLLGRDLLLQGDRRGLDGSEFRAESRLLLRLLRPYCAEG
jgi:hypothetical protein